MVKFTDPGFRVTTEGRFEQTITFMIDRTDNSCSVSVDEGSEFWLDVQDIEDLIASLQEAKRRILA